MTMMSVLDKSLVIISPDRNKKDVDDLRKRISEVYIQSKVSFSLIILVGVLAFVLNCCRISLKCVEFIIYIICLIGVTFTFQI